MTNIDVTRGDDVQWTITLTAGGSPVDITGWTFAGMVRATPDGSLAATWAFTPVTPLAGIIRASLSAASTATLAAGVYGFDMECVNLASLKKTFIAGKIVVRADYTYA